MVIWHLPANDLNNTLQKSKYYAGITYIIIINIIIIIYLIANGLTPGGSSAATIYTQTVHKIQRTKRT